MTGRRSICPTHTWNGTYQTPRRRKRRPRVAREACGMAQSPSICHAQIHCISVTRTVNISPYSTRDQFGDRARTLTLSPLGMAKLDLPRAIRLDLDAIRDDVYLGRIQVSDELGKHRADQGLHPTCNPVSCLRSVKREARGERQEARGEEGEGGKGATRDRNSDLSRSRTWTR